MHLFFSKKKLGRILAIILFLLLLTPTTQAAEKNYDNLFVYIGDSLMKVKSGEGEAISENMALFETQWNAVKIDSKQADEVDQCLLDVKNALEKGHDMKQVKGKLSSLSESLVAYDTAQNPIDTDKDKKQLQALIPFIDEMKVTIQRISP